MSKQASPALMGAFVLLGIALLVFGLIFFGSGAMFTETIKYVAYFEGSVNGLQAGSPVRFRGAPVGAVTDIHLELYDKGERILLPVTFEIVKNRVFRVDKERGGEDESDEGVRQMIQAMIESGLRASLAIESIVSGQLYVELDFHPNTEANYVRGPSPYPEFPTVPSPFQKLSETIRRIPIEQIAKSMQESLEGLARFINSEELAETVASFNDATQRASETLSAINSKLGPLSEDMRRAIKDTEVTLKAAQASLKSVEKLASEGSPVRYQLISTLQEVQAAAEALRGFADYAERHPEAFLFGKQKGDQP